VMAVLLGIICAIGLALSALLARSTTSSVLTYVAVFVLVLGTIVLAGMELRGLKSQPLLKGDLSLCACPIF